LGCKEAGKAVNHSATLDQGSAGSVITDDLSDEFYALGLAGCIDKLTVPLRQEGVSVHWETPHHGIEIPASSAGLLYQAAQETLANAYKYAHATDLTVRLAAVYHGVRLTVTDNGVGFSQASQSTGGRKHGYGVHLMTMAVHQAHGTIAIDSAPGEGTRVSITLPLD
jgi:signal transduction histidine kinase